jgi:hypothetical protein
MVFKRLHISKRAKINFGEALDYYQKINPKYSEALYAEVFKCYYYIVRNPYMFQKRYDEVRICFTEGYPYAVYYIVRIDPTTSEEHIYIVNILHTKRLFKNFKFTISEYN